MHGERSNLRRSKGFVLGPNVPHLDRLARDFKRWQLRRRNEVAQILPKYFVLRLPIHGHPRTDSFRRWLEPLHEIRADAAAEFLESEHVTPRGPRQFYRALHKEISQVREESAGKGPLRTTKPWRGAARG